MVSALMSCGRQPSSLLRQGQLPINDFPLYQTDGSGGFVYKYDLNRNRATMASGLNNPTGVATDRWGNVFVVEAGAGKLLKIKASTGAISTVATGLQAPSVVAVDSFGEAYVAQDTPHNVIRAVDGTVVASFFTLPGAIVAGIRDTLIIGDTTGNKVYWGKTASSPSTTVTSPVNIAVDGMGRVYVAEGLSTNARVIRYHQSQPGGSGTVVANSLSGPQGIAVDAAANIFIVEKGNSRIVLVTQDGLIRSWVSGLTDPQYLAFTQY